MYEISLPTKTQSIWLVGTTATEGMLQVLAIAREYVRQYVEQHGTQDFTVIVHQRTFPDGSEPGRLRLDLALGKPRVPGSCRIELAFTFTRIESESGLTICDVGVRQKAAVESKPGTDLQAQQKRVQQLRTAYQSALAHSSIGNVLASWDVVLGFARANRPAKLGSDRVAEFEKVFLATTVEVHKRVDWHNVEYDGKKVTIRTLIDDELPQNPVMFRVKPSQKDPEVFELFTRNGDAMLKENGESKHPSGKYNFVVRNGQTVIGDIGHYYLSNGGKNVEFAGAVKFNHGAVEWWNNDSGHFRPHPGMFYNAPFPLNRFEAVHVGFMVKERNEKEEKERLRLARAPLDAAILDAFKNRGQTKSAQDAMRAIAVQLKSKVEGISNNKVKNRMYELGAITDLKTMTWDESLEDE